MNPRQRRLTADFARIKEEFTHHPYIRVEYDSKAELPEKYFVYFHNVLGFKLSEHSTPEKKAVEIVTNHKIEIYLHLDYPRMKPQCYILTEIFHPNFRMAQPHDICIGDYWAPGESLVDVIYQIGEMIQYKVYNITSPLNGIASKWARENINLFPVDMKDLRQGNVDIEFK